MSLTPRIFDSPSLGWPDGYPTLAAAARRSTGAMCKGRCGGRVAQRVLAGRELGLTRQGLATLMRRLGVR